MTASCRIWVDRQRFWLTPCLWQSKFWEEKEEGMYTGSNESKSTIWAWSSIIRVCDGENTKTSGSPQKKKVRKENSIFCLLVNAQKGPPGKLSLCWGGLQKVTESTVKGSLGDISHLGNLDLGYIVQTTMYTYSIAAPENGNIYIKTTSSINP